VIRPTGPARVLRPCCFFQTQVAVQQVVIGRQPAPLLTRKSNTDRKKSAETMKRSMSDRWPNYSLHEMCLCRKKVFMIHSALLQYSCSSSLPLCAFVSITMSLDHIHPYPSIVPNAVLKSSKKIVNSLVSTFLEASLIYSMNSRYSSLGFGPYTCIKEKERPNNFNISTHTLPSSWIHSSKQLSIWGLTNLPTPP